MSDTEQSKIKVSVSMKAAKIKVKTVPRNVQKEDSNSNSNSSTNSKVSVKTPLKVPKPKIKTNTVIDLQPELRKKTQTCLVKLLETHADAPLIPKQVILDLEQAFYESVISWAHEKGITEAFDTRLESSYNCRLDRLIQHLHPQSNVNNTYLRPRLLNGELSPEDIAAMHNESDMNPYHWRCAQQKAVEARQISHGRQAALSDLIPCGKCGGPTAMDEQQTRGGDEAMTVFVFCPKCKISFVV